MFRPIEPATPTSSSSTVQGAGEELEASELVDHLQCHEDMLDGFSDHYSASSRTSSAAAAAAVARDVWSGMRSGPASIENSPCRKRRREHLRAGSEHSDSHLLGAGGVGGRAGAAESEDERVRRQRNGSECSGVSAEVEAHDMEAHDIEARSWLAHSPKRQVQSSWSSRQRGGFAMLNIKSPNKAMLNTKSPNNGKVPMSPPMYTSVGGVMHMSSASPGLLAAKRSRVNIRDDAPTMMHAAFPSPHRTCVSMPFGLLKPFSPGFSYIFTHTCVDIYTYTYVHKHIDVLKKLSICVYVHTFPPVYTWGWVRVCVCVCVCVCVLVCVCVY